MYRSLLASVVVPLHFLHLEICLNICVCIVDMRRVVRFPETHLEARLVVYTARPIAVYQSMLSFLTVSRFWSLSICIRNAHETRISFRVPTVPSKCTVTKQFQESEN